MPLVAHNGLPTFRRLRDSGHEVLSFDRARRRDVRELRIGLLNMMPDAALAATEQQFMRLVGACAQDTHFYVYPFSLPELDRSADAVEHISQYYSAFAKLTVEGLDALIITGANVANPSLDQEPFWGPLIDVVRWAEQHVASILCSCLATHALVKHRHGIERRRLPQKRWGVYDHRVTRPGHPLVAKVDTSFDAPHSRYNEVAKSQFEEAGLVVLAESPEAGVHLAVSPDQFRVVYFQGHPEYQTNSLLKEYKREVHRWFDGELDAPPPQPEAYFPDEAVSIASQFIERAGQAMNRGDPLPEFPEKELESHVSNTWRDSGAVVFDNWLRLVNELTNADRRLQFAAGVDPDDPLRQYNRHHG